MMKSGRGILGRRKDKDTVRQFVPIEPKRDIASKVLDSILEAGYTWKMATGRGRRNNTRAGMVRSVSSYLDDLEGVMTHKESKGEHTKVYSRESSN